MLHCVFIHIYVRYPIRLLQIKTLNMASTFLFSGFYTPQVWNFEEKQQLIKRRKYILNRLFMCNADHEKGKSSFQQQRNV